MTVPYNPSNPRSEWKNRESFLEEMDNVPLFMKTLPKDTDNNETLLALQSLAYDGTPEGKILF